MNHAKDLSILIPARNEMFLARTVQDILEKMRGDTEILVGLDGQWASPPIPQHDKVTVLYYPNSIGQRALTNQLAKISQAKYVMKTDAHVCFDEGFDVKLMSEMKDDYTMIPLLRHLHVFDWKCKKCGSQWDQGKTPTQCFLRAGKSGKDKVPNPNCDNTTEFERVMFWEARKSPTNITYRFDNTLHFQYWKELADRPEAQVNEHLVESMSAQGSCFMLTREKYFELNICDEGHGSWGQQGTEIACKTWLSGGKLVINKKTWYAHLFRTQGGDFGFPYPNDNVTKAREYSKDLWFSNLEDLKKKWSPAKHDLKWLLDKFAPIPDWDMTKGIVYYTDNKLDPKIMEACQKQLKESAKNRRIVSVSLKKTDFGENITLNLERGYLTMAKQILAGLKELDTDIVFLCEHDVLYHPTHFDFIPSNKETIYYNTNVWRVRYEDGHAIRTDDCRQLSGLCAYRDVLIKHFEKRVSLLQDKLNSGVDERTFNGYIRSMGFEPGTHNREERVDDLKSERWEAPCPNLDIRHGENLTPTRWSKDKFRNEKYTRGWQEANELPEWGILKDVFNKY